MFTEQSPWPLELRVSPVVAFVEVPIVGHLRYTSIEIQQLRTPAGAGLAAIVHRTDGAVDVYFEPVLGLDDTWRATDPAMSHLTAGVLQSTAFEARELDIQNDAIACDIAFRDANGEVIRLTIRQARRWGMRVRMFVPMPAGAANAVLRLLLLDRFCMIRRSGTVLDVRVGPHRCTPASFALPVGYARRYSGRFSRPVLLAGLNPAGSYAPRPLAQADLDGAGDMLATRIGTGDDWFELRFSPALRRPDRLPPGDIQRGRLSIVSPLGQVTEARWSLRRPSEAVVELDFDEVRQNWFPSPIMQPTLSVLAGLRWLKRRRTSLGWKGRLVLDQGLPMLHSEWTTVRSTRVDAVASGGPG